MGNITHFSGKLLAVKELAPEVRHFVFEVPSTFTFLPGQYVFVQIPLSDGKHLKKPYSIASSPHQQGTLELCLNLVKGGQGSGYLFQLKRGETVDFTGPMGRFTIHGPDKPAIFIATGTGIAPFRSMISTLLTSGKQQSFILLAGYRKEDSELYGDTFRELAREHRNFSYHSIISQPHPTSAGKKGRVQLLVEKYLPPLFTGDIYLCGLREMVDETTKLLLSKGIDESRIHFERYD
ncbi:FAD-dependent oxidoreductase [Candidatus Woesearchaeota archaeon]|nr:FAD-dependent oxidoreductase [Candidatus Woesearchaeota archaeon]